MADKDITYQVFVDWLNDGAFGHTFSRITDDVIKCNIRYGKSSIDREFEAGTLELVVKNDDARYSPISLIRVGPYANWPDLDLNLAVEVWAIIQNGEGKTGTYDWFRLGSGYIDSFVPTPALESQECLIRCRDAVKFLELIKITTAIYQNQGAHTLMGTILDIMRLLRVNIQNWFYFTENGGYDAAHPMFDSKPLGAEFAYFLRRRIDDTDIILPYAWWTEETSRSALYGLSLAAGGELQVNPHIWCPGQLDGVTRPTIGRSPHGQLPSILVQEPGLIFENRYHLMIDPHKTVQYTFSDTAGQHIDLSYEYTDAAIENVIRVSAYTYKLDDNAGTIYQLEAVPIFFAKGEAKTFHCEYSVAALNVVTSYTQPDGNHVATSEEDGTGTDLTADFAVAITPYAEFAEVTITNNSASNGFLVYFRIEGTPIRSSSATVAEYKAAESMGKYFERKAEINEPRIQLSSDADRLAGQRGLKRSAPRRNPGLRMVSGPTTPAVYSTPHIMGELSERVRLTLQQVSHDFHIVNITHTIDFGGREHIVDWLLEDALVENWFFFSDDWGVIDAQIAANSDDAYSVDPNIWLSDNVKLDFSGVSYQNWLRWLNIAVPRLATIGKAYLELKAIVTTVGSSNEHVKGILETDTATFSTFANANARPLTTAQVDWTPGDWTSGSWYGGASADLLDVTAIIQEIVNQDGWVSGNALGIKLWNSPSAVTRQADDYESAAGAKLHIEYNPGPVIANFDALPLVY